MKKDTAKSYGFENPFLPDSLSKKAMRYLGNKRRQKLLDVGCGEGADSVLFAQRGFDVTAIDKNEAYLKRFRSYRKDHGLSISILERDAVNYRYPRIRFDVILCLLVICCMKRSEFEDVLQRIKGSVKRGGTIIMSSRNYLDPELKEFRKTKKAVEPNTFPKEEECCRFGRFTYFIEKNRLREVFSDFEILYYYEGYSPCKYNEHPRHGDSYIICRRRK